MLAHARAGRHQQTRPTPLGRRSAQSDSQDPDGRAAEFAQQQSSRPPRSNECFATKGTASSDAPRTIAWATFRSLKTCASAIASTRMLSRLTISTSPHECRFSIKGTVCPSAGHGRVSGVL